MKNCILNTLLLVSMVPVFGGQINCNPDVIGYKVLKKSMYPFFVGKDKACFFAFYTTNPDPGIDTKGNGNLGDSVWYGYYKINDSKKIYEFPKPSDNDWGNVCTIDAISFLPMHGNRKRDVTIIGSCENNVHNLTFPLVFILQGGKFILDEEVYRDLHGMIALTVEDVRQYIKSPETQYTYLSERYWKD